MKVIYFIFSLFVNKQTFSQNSDSGIRIIPNIKISNSQILLIPKLEILTEDITVQIKKKRFYVNEIEKPDVDCIFFIKKKVGRVYVNISLPGLYDKVFSDVGDAYVDFKKGDKLKDTVNLDNYLPLEPGQYLISLQFRYLKDNQLQVIYSEDESFVVKTIPKNSNWFFNNKTRGKRKFSF